MLITGCQTSDSRLGAYAPTGQPTATVHGIRLYVRPEVSAFAKQHAVNVLDVLRPVIERVVDELRSPRTSVVVQMNARQAIYEVGVGGSTHPTRGSVVISLSDGPDEDKDKRALTTWLAPTVAHELNHSARIIDGPGYGRSLLATMVSEGLADQFSQAVVPGTPVPPWTSALTDAQSVALWGRAQPLLSKQDRGTNRKWLFGGNDIPRWTAYTLGSRIVAQQREHRPGESWRDLTREAADRILRESSYAPSG